MSDRSDIESSSVSAEDLEILAYLMEKEQQARLKSQRITPRQTSEPAALSFAQQRLWVLDQMEITGAAYNWSFALLVSGALELDCLEQSLSEIVRRHEVLRTTIRVSDNKPFQYINLPAPVTVESIDLSSLSSTEKEAELSRLFSSAREDSFDLENGPLLRTRLLRLEPERHVLILSMHHIVADGWSFGIFLRELVSIYTSLSNGNAVALPDLPVQYADYAVWQRSWLGGEELKRQLEYWDRQLRDLAVLELPTTRSRPALQTFNGAQHSLLLPNALVRSIRNLALEEDVTLFILLLAAFSILLHKYSGQDDIVVGSPVANRNQVEIENLIGCFLNMLVLRSDMSGNPDFRELLKRTKNMVFGAFEHQDLPFERVVEELHPERDGSRNPLFQVTFTLQETRNEEMAAAGDISFTDMPMTTPTARFDLEIYVSDEQQNLGLSVVYNTDLFDTATISKMFDHYRVLLEGIVADPDRRISELSILTEAELRQLLGNWNQATADYPPDKTIHELFEAQSAATPEAVVLEFESQSLSYAELNDSANRLANYLRSHGVGPETLVGLCLDRGLEMMIGILGILKAGGAYVPMDPQYPESRIEFMLEDSQAPLILTQQSLRETFPTYGGEIVCLDSDWHLISQQNNANLPAGGRADSLAYVIYTSGSTGQPKGVLVTHYNVTRLFEATEQWYGFNEADVWTLFHSSAFDFSVWEIWGALLHGGRLVVVPYEISRSPDQFHQLLEDAGVTVLNQTPSAIRQLIAIDESKPATSLSALRLVIFGGEALDPQSLGPWFEKHGDVKPQLVNMYGITETTVHVSYRPLTSSVVAQTASVIGSAIPDLQIFILDRYLQPVPVGVPGEMYVGGAGLARGYLNRPELTEERFIAHPFSDRDGARLYKTGDLARYLPDGDIEYLGRIDHQVKLRGFRIELGEIESLLVQHGAVREAVVLMREDKPGDKRLAGYVVADQAEADALSAVDLRVYLRDRLPEYMVPATIQVMDRFPTTENGKLDRRALLESDDVALNLEAEYIPPRTELETQIAQIWAEVLQVERLGIYDDFFDLGGHSIMATQVVSRMNDALAVRLPLSKIFQHSTIAELSPLVESLDRDNLDSASREIPPVERDRNLPLSFAQQRMWFLDRLEPGSPVYNTPWALKLKGDLDVEALRGSLQEIVNRHEVLRTTYDVHLGEPVQKISTTHVFELPEQDLSDIGESAQAIELSRIMGEFILQPFELGSGPVIRSCLLRLDDDEHVLIVSMHHIVCDAWSLGIFFRELAALYAALSRGHGSPLPALKIQYADFASWQRNWLSGAELESQLNYWKQQLDGATVLELPTDRPRSAKQTYAGAHQGLILSNELTEKLEALDKQQGVTAFMTLLTAFVMLLKTYCRQEDIVVGSPIANRNRREIEDLIGFFVNTLVLRTDVSGNPTFIELLQRVKQVAVEAYEHQDLPFEMLVDELQLERELSHSPLFQVIFSVQNAPISSLKLEGLTLEGMQDELETTHFDLETHIFRGAQGLFINFVYNTDLFDADTIQRMLDNYRTLLEGIASNPGRKISDFNLLSEQQQRQLFEINRTVTDYPRDKTVHELFEQQANATPDAIAVEYEDQTLSYGQLNAQANQLGHYLRSRGVGPEVMVGICVDRSLEMVVGLLGILKAGGAYVPLDPDYPLARLSFMLEDARIKTILTTSSRQSHLPLFAGETIILDNDWAEIARESIENPSPNTTANNLVYVIFTSGSTGRPKGSLIEHRSAVRLVKQTNYVELGSQEVFLQFAPVAFDASTFELWGSLLNGARLVVFPAGPASLEKLGQVIRQKKVTTLWLTGALFNQMVDEQLASLKGIKQLLAGGEALSVPHVKKMLALPGERRLINGYGPTENTTFTCCHVMTADSELGQTVPIGRPISNTSVYILDTHMKPLPVGVAGELYIGGDGLARGYLNRPELTAEKFVANPFSDDPAACLYATGDLVRHRPDGAIEFIGRIDQQVKIRGYRIEPGEVEVVLNSHEAIRNTAAMVREDSPGDKRLVVYLVPEEGSSVSINQVRDYTKLQLPGYMLPSAFIVLDELPVTPNGKLDRDALPAPDYGSAGTSGYVAPRGEIELKIEEIWCELLGIEKAGAGDNFFDLGGHSLLLSQVQARLNEAFDCKLSMLELFQYPTIQSLAFHLAGEDGEAAEFARARTRMNKRGDRAADGEAIAIVGMSGRFPGAASIAQFWENIANGVESIRFFSDEELTAAGIPEHVIADARFVRAKGHLDGADLFDAAFFGYAPHEAELIDPQQRLFLECAWEALESAGYDPERYQGMIGVYAGATSNTYEQNLNSHPELLSNYGMQVFISSDKDFMPSRVSYKLNLRGPSLTVQTACSTSLVAIHEARKSLLDFECDLALAGGVAVLTPRIQGYMYQEEGILSADGHCRAFSADASGTVGGEGVGIVALKRLSEAMQDDDVIHAVIRGSAINNDGSNKVGFTAPSFDGQAEVIALAQAAAGVSPDGISYIETHGTGTRLGDPIEMAALARVFRESGGERENDCAIGAIKTNIGHLDAAAGVASVIKTALALEHRQIPPSLNYSSPNPEIDFEHSPFYVNTELVPWESDGGHPRRAGVSSFGIGGTNAHAVLEEAPPRDESEPGREWQFLPVSAKNEDALAAYADRIADYLERNSGSNLADVSYTLRTGRGQFEYRCAAVGNDIETGAADLRLEKGAWTTCDVTRSPPVIFMFPGQGSQHLRMAQGLYESEDLFREVVEDCCEQLQPEIGVDLRELMFAEAADTAQSEERLRQTLVAQCALFVIEYALARLWMSWGIRPAAMIGHSIGEYVAACISGVIELPAALSLIASRGQAMAQAPAGAMMAVSLPEEQIVRYLKDDLWLSVINGPENCVISGTEDAIDELEHCLRADGVESARVNTSGAFHSGLMDDVLPGLNEAAGKLNISAPGIPYISNVTGGWIEPSQLEMPEYWGQHLRSTVRFSQGVDALLEKFQAGMFLEIGPGKTLSSMLRRRISDFDSGVEVLSSLSHPREKQADGETIARALAGLWCNGVEIDWPSYDKQGRRCRVELPTYPFQRKSFWVENASAGAVAGRGSARQAMQNWFYAPEWKSSRLPANGQPTDLSGEWMVFANDSVSCEKIIAHIELQGGRVVRVIPGNEFAEVSASVYSINPTAKADYLELFSGGSVAPEKIRGVIHCWGVNRGQNGHSEVSTEIMQLEYYSLLYLAQALISTGGNPLPHIDVLTQFTQAVDQADVIVPEKSMAAAMMRVVSQENIDFEYTIYDLLDAEIDSVIEQQKDSAKLPLALQAIFNSSREDSVNRVVVLRRNRRWLQVYDQISLERTLLDGLPLHLRERGVYLITGGLGRVGFALAGYLANNLAARLVLTARTALPERSEWDRYLQANGAEDKLARIMLQVRQLEACGAEVTVSCVDVSDLAAMQQLVEQVVAEYGEINGVVHAAGVVSGASMAPFQSLSHEDCESQFVPKVHGLMVLKKLFEEYPLDFVMPVSSLSVVLGGLGFAAYASANQFMDSVCQQLHNNGNTQWLCVDWDGWLFDELDEARATGMTAAEGGRVFEKLLNNSLGPQVIISCSDLDARLRQWVYSRPGEAAEEDDPGQRYERPELSSNFVDANTESQKQLSAIWRRLFKLNQVGIHDNFFELGGDSLLAIQAIAAIREEFNTSLSIDKIFELGSIDKIASHIDALAWVKADTEENFVNDGSRKEFEL